jgi:hypothetical protein
MRYKLLALSFAAVAVVGCGDPSNDDPPGPVQLVRIMVQDSQPFGARGVAMDLLDVPGSLFSTAVACDASHPCTVPYTMQHIEPTLTCGQGGLCNDPLAAGLAPLTPPETHRQGEAGGTQLRLVFSKLLDASIKTETVLEVDDASGAAVTGIAEWDPSGAANISSDVILIPYGPALVFKPDAPFQAGAQYTIKLDGSKVRDRAGNPLADQSGTIVTGTYTKAFTTEGIMLLPQTTLTNVATAAAVTITPDEILQLGFNAPAAATTACTATMGGAPVAVKAYAEGGGSCAAPDATLLNIVAVDGAGAPADWAAGSYTVSCTVAAAGGGGSTTVSGSFSVAGTATAGDPQSRTQHPVCAAP